MRLFVGPKVNTKAPRVIMTTAACTTATLRPRAPNRTEPYTAMRPSEAHKVRLREKTTGNSESGTRRRTSLSRPGFSLFAHEARRKGTRRAKLPPQSLVKTKGAAGRGTG